MRRPSPSPEGIWKSEAVGGVAQAELDQREHRGDEYYAQSGEDCQSGASEPQRFGELLRGYRTELGLTQRALGDILGVDTSTIARVETGARNPPRDADFYQHLYDIPGLDESHVRALLATPDAPRLVVPSGPTQLPPPKPLPKVEIATLGDLQVVLTLGGNTSDFPDDELQRVLRSARETTEVLLKRLSERSASPPKCTQSPKLSVE